MICRGTGFLAVVLFGSFPTPQPPLLLASCLSFSYSCVSPVELPHGRGWGGGGEEPNNTTARKPGDWSQNVFNVLQRTKLSRHHMIWLLLPPPSPRFSRQQGVSLSQTSCVSPGKLTDGRGGKGFKSYNSEEAQSSIMHKILSSWSAINHSILSGEEGGWGGGGYKPYRIPLPVRASCSAREAVSSCGLVGARNGLHKRSRNCGTKWRLADL